jgi:serine/threonine-protein kinase
MAAAEELDKPEPLPLVGTLPKDHAGAANADRLDATRHAGAEQASADAPVADLTAPIAAAAGAGTTRVFEREEREPAPRAAGPPGVGTSTAAGATATDAGPRRRRRWPWVLLAVLLVAGVAGGGATAWFLTRTISHDIPDMRGWKEAEFQAVVEKNNWALGDRLTGRSDQYPTVGMIISTDPASGKLAEGKAITYTVSLGPELVDIPELPGATTDAAKQQLEAVGLKLADPVKHENSETVEQGKIIRIDGTDRQLPRGSTVQVVVSDGPAPRIIPAGVENQQFEAVQKQLTDLGLQVQRADDYSDTVQTGRVIGLRGADGTPVAANSQVPRGTQVTVVVSKGPAPRPIPDVAGRTLAQAVDAMKNAGFTVTNISGDVSKPVLVSDPPAGEIKPFGTQVKLIMRST